MKGRKPQQGAVRRGLRDASALQAAPPADVGVAMPADIAADPVQSEIWAWIAPPSNCFSEQDLPTLRLLCHWHAVAAQAQEAMRAEDGGVDIFDRIGTKPFAASDGRELPLVRKNPALTVLKEASSEIRALSDMLGLSPLARSRIGLLNASTVKTAAEIRQSFASIDAGYPELKG